jgi:CBS domain-containing protein
MKAADVMSHDPLSVMAQTPILKAGCLMLQHKISGLPVTDGDGKIVGIVTEGDLLRRVETGTERRHSRGLEFLLGPGRLAGGYVSTHAHRVGEVMTGDVAVVRPSDDLADVVGLMEKRHIKRVPVVENGKLVGIVSRADLVRALVRKLTEAGLSRPETVSDQDIQKAVVAIIDREPWGPLFSVHVTVNDGAVDLYGTITDDRERTALIVAAEGVAGVKTVNDHLVWVEPNSGLVIGADEAR